MAAKPRSPKPPKLRPAKLKGAQPKKKRSKRPTCRQVDTFPCGYSCKNKMYRDKKTGAMEETQCGNVLKGQSKNYVQWVKEQTERLQLVNAKRNRAGLGDAITTNALAIDKQKTKKLLKKKIRGLDDKTLDRTAKAAKAKGKTAIADQLEQEKADRKAGKSKPTIAARMRGKDRAQAVKELDDRELDVMIRTTAKRSSQTAKELLGLLQREKASRAQQPQEPPRPTQPIRTLKKGVITDRQDLLPRFRRSFVPIKHRDNLSPVQQEGVARAIEAMGRDATGAFIMADGAGLGKTRQQLAIADYYASRGKKVLVISPNAVLKPDYKTGKVAGSFDEDGQKMGIDYRLNRGQDQLEAGEIHLGTYENLDRFKEMVDRDTVLLLDEAHMLKNLQSKRTEHGMEMLDKVGAVLYATATPADKPEHLYYLHRADAFDEVKSSALARHMGIRKSTATDGSVTWGKERAKGRTKKKDDDGTKQDLATRQAIAVSNLFDELTASGKMMRREISMEGVKVKMTPIAVPEAAKNAMDMIADRYAMADQGSMATAREILDKRRQLEPFKVPEAVRLAQKAIKKGNQVVIFADRVNKSTVYKMDKQEGVEDAERPELLSSEGTIKLLMEQLMAAGISPNDIVELHGNAEMKAPDAMKEFQSGKRKILLTTQGSGGTGINLDDNIGDKPRTLISMTPSFSANEFMQMVGRVWRSQTNSIPDIHCLFSDIEIDNWGKDLLSSKLITLGAIVGGAPKKYQNLDFRERLQRLRHKNRFNPLAP